MGRGEVEVLSGCLGSGEEGLDRWALGPAAGRGADEGTVSPSTLITPQQTAAHLPASAYFTLNSHISHLSHRLRPLDVLLCVCLLQNLSLRLAACILRRQLGCALLHRLPPREPAGS